MLIPHLNFLYVKGVWFLYVKCVWYLKALLLVKKQSFSCCTDTSLKCYWIKSFLSTATVDEISARLKSASLFTVKAWMDLHSHQLTIHCAVKLLCHKYDVFAKSYFFLFFLTVSSAFSILFSFIFVWPLHIVFVLFLLKAQVILNKTE